MEIGLLASHAVNPFQHCAYSRGALSLQSLQVMASEVWCSRDEGAGKAMGSSIPSISCYSHTLQHISFRSQQSLRVFWSKGKAPDAAVTRAGCASHQDCRKWGPAEAGNEEGQQLDPAVSSTPAMRGRAATQPCASGTWKLTGSFQTEIFMEQELHHWSQWPWVCPPSSAAGHLGKDRSRPPGAWKSSQLLAADSTAAELLSYP